MNGWFGGGLVGAALAAGCASRAPLRPEIAPGAFVLTVENAPVTVGETLELRLTNRGETVAFHHPGGSNGCSAFGWRIALSRQDGTVYRNESPDRVCTMAIVEPRDITIASGESFQLAFPTRGAFSDATVGGMRPEQAKSEPLPPGNYTVSVSGGPISARASFALLAAP